MLAQQRETELLALIGEQFDHGDEICGDVVNVRNRQEKIVLWTKNAANEAAQNSVLALEDTALDPDQVENLIKFCPTKEEIELLKGYKGEKEKLGKCEQVSDLIKALNVLNNAAEETLLYSGHLGSDKITYAQGEKLIVICVHWLNALRITKQCGRH